VKGEMKGKCFYANNAAGARGLCNIPINTHSWRYPSQADPGFVCGKVKPKVFQGKLGAKNGVKAATYVFMRMTLTARSGKYADQMKAHCSKVGMRPVCEHRNYCKNDKAALYLGQTHHLGYPGHRYNTGWFPSGWTSIRAEWNGMCNYAAKVQGGGNALCNLPGNSHSWQGTGYNPGFICGANAKPCTSTQVANSDKSKRGSIAGKAGTSIKVTCNTGFSGGGMAQCQPNGKFNTVKCQKLQCASTRVLNSNKAGTGSIKGAVGARVTVKCNSGFDGGGTAVCGNDGRFKTSGIQCRKKCGKCEKCEGKLNSCQRADGDSDGKITIEDLLILLSQYGNKC